MKHYLERYVAFIDILGFQSIIERSETDGGLVIQLELALSRISHRATASRSSAAKIEATHFSDTAVLSAPTDVDSLATLVKIIDDFSIDLLTMGMLFRGSIVRGKLRHTQEVVFGPALIEAYRLESNRSFHPRIMLSNAVHHDIQVSSAQEPWTTLLPRYISVEPYDVPHLNPFARWHEDEAAWSDDAMEKLIRLQSIISEGLLDSQNEPNIAEKYKWLARKLNKFIAQKRLGARLARIDVD